MLRGEGFLPDGIFTNFFKDGTPFVSFNPLKEKIVHSIYISHGEEGQYSLIKNIILSWYYLPTLPRAAIL